MNPARLTTPIRIPNRKIDLLGRESILVQILIGF